MQLFSFGATFGAGALAKTRDSCPFKLTIQTRKFENRGRKSTGYWRRNLYTVSMFAWPPGPSRVQVHFEPSSYKSGFPTLSFNLSLVAPLELRFNGLLPSILYAIETLASFNSRVDVASFEDAPHHFAAGYPRGWSLSALPAILARGRVTSSNQLTLTSIQPGIALMPSLTMAMLAWRRSPTLIYLTNWWKYF